MYTDEATKLVFRDMLCLSSHYMCEIRIDGLGMSEDVNVCIDGIRRARASDYIMNR